MVELLSFTKCSVINFSCYVLVERILITAQLLNVLKYFQNFIQPRTDTCLDMDFIGFQMQVKFWEKDQELIISLVSSKSKSKSEKNEHSETQLVDTQSSCRVSCSS